jgi:tripeptide aminopeptidase
MDKAVSDLMDVLDVPGISTEEAEIAAFLDKFLRSQGVPADAIRYDRTQDQSEYGGQIGNMIVRLPARGGHTGPSRMFMAHIDTVALCRGAKPRVDLNGQPRRVVNDNPESALGADDRSGVAVMMHLVRWLAESKVAHPSITLVFTVQEELGLVGARGLDLKAIKPDPPVMAFNYDGGEVETIIVAVTGTTRFFIDVFGKAAHTGVNPQDGASAAVAAAKALADLARDGWHGPINRDGGTGSANIGVMSGGEMTNTVMDKMIIRGEARSHDAVFRQRIVDLYREAFQRAAGETKNAAGESVRTEWKLGPCYESYAIRQDDLVVKTTVSAMSKLGIQPNFMVSDGGMDANWINPRGLPMVTLGSGQHGAHTVEEWVNLEEYLAACALIEKLSIE